MQVAAVARVPPDRLQLIVAPESWVVGGASDVPGLEEREGWVSGLLGGRGGGVWITYIPLSVVTMGL